MEELKSFVLGTAVIWMPIVTIIAGGYILKVLNW